MRSVIIASALVLAALPALAQEAVPSALVSVEEGRSRACVPALANLERLDAALAPLARRADRIQALNQAMALEDTAEVAPFDPTRPLDLAVRDWFAEDRAIALRLVESGDSTLLEQRRARREAVRQVLRDTLEAVGARGQRLIEEGGDIQTASGSCQGAILVRPVVLEACAGVDAAVCDAARSQEPQAGFRFVDAAADLWDVGELRPWTDPTPLRRAQDGTIGGARTATRARQGNVVVILRLGPLLRARADLSDEEVQEFEANLEAMGFDFEHPRLVMAPALELVVDILAPLAGETHYLLHFGGLENPAEDLIWQAPAGGEGAVQAIFPAAPGVLARLQAGELVSLTAVRLSEGETPEAAEAEALYSISLAAVNQSRAVGGLLGYMAGGQMSRDLAALVPPEGGR